MPLKEWILDTLSFWMCPILADRSHRLDSSKRAEIPIDLSMKIFAAATAGRDVLQLERPPFPADLGLYAACMSPHAQRTRVLAFYMTGGDRSRG